MRRSLILLPLLFFFFTGQALSTAPIPDNFYGGGMRPLLGDLQSLIGKRAEILSITFNPYEMTVIAPDPKKPGAVKKYILATQHDTITESVPASTYSPEDLKRLTFRLDQISGEQLVDWAQEVDPISKPGGKHGRCCDLLEIKRNHPNGKDLMFRYVLTDSQNRTISVDLDINGNFLP